jgi:hypothetical protein
MRALLSISVLLLGVTWAMAQNTPAQSNQKTYNQMSDHSGTEHSVEGCLSSSGGNYMLTSDKGKTFMLAGDTSKLEEHVGHEVIITGTRKSASGESAGTMSNQGNEPTIDVTAVKHISKTCKNAGTMSH